MTAPAPTLDTIFLAAIDIDSVQERAAYISQACGGDAELQGRVDKLVVAHFQAGSFLEKPAGDRGLTSPEGQRPDVAAPVPRAEGPGSRIGPYKLLQQIGEGGMGTVFMAEQTQPVQRRIALKIIKPGMDSRQVVARFEAERQALALMDHPNIAKVLDAGTTEGGRPFFVMELVKGVPITRYCDEHHLTPRQRLELFLPVCQAVQHAHQKGIIHRDLKPSNVMMCLYDGQPVPKVIDFGVAKATGARLTEKTLFTEFGQVVGTLEYMSPEQAQLDQLDSDTRSDIYSLGVLLYELLTGTTPLERKRVKEGAILEVLRLIREEEPPRPSTRLSSTEELPSIAANRGLEPKKLRGLVRGELDWIVMKCLEKDRNRRYETANGLARDLERYLHDEPVQACPPSVGYRLRKFVRRHKGPVLAASLVLLALVAGIIGTTWELIRATDAEAAAVNAANQKEAALTEAQKSERNANDQLFGALFNQAHAWRFGGQAGQRFDSLKALAEAARIARAREFGDEEILKLRNEAIACLALPDLRFERTLMERRYLGNEYWIAFDPPFHHFVYSDREGNLSIRRVADGEETARLPGPDARPQWVHLRFSPDGGWLHVQHEFLGRLPQVALWELRDGKLGRKVVLEHWCDFSPDSRLAAGARPDGAIGVYEVASGREVKRLAEGMGATGVTFHPDGRQLAVSVKSDPRLIAVLDLETGKEVAPPYKHPLGVHGVAWRGDGRLLAVSCNDQRIYVWDHAKRQPQSVLEGHTNLFILVKFSHAGDFLISTAWDFRPQLWDPVTGRQLVREPASHFVDIRRDGRQVALLKDDRLALWELTGGWECRTLHHGLVGNRTDRPGEWGPRSVDFSPDGRLLVSGSLDGARLWDLATFTEIGHLPAGPTDSVLFHPDGDSLFTYGQGGLHRWPIRREIKRPADQPDGIEVLRVGPPQALDVPGNWAYAYIDRDRRGRWLAAVDYVRSRVIVLDLDDPRNKLVLEHPGVAACHLSPDGRWAVTWTRPDFKDPTTKVWDTSDGKPVLWKPPAGELFNFFTPDGGWLVTSPPGNSPLRLWKLGSWEPGPTLPKYAPNQVQFMPSPDGTLLVPWDWASGAAPKLIHAGTGKALATLEPPRDVPTAYVRFSPDGTRFAVATSNHTVHVWDLRTLRRGLAEVGLDWDLPPYKPAPVNSGKPLQVEVDPGNIKAVMEAQVHLQQAAAQVQAGQWDKAVTAYSKALELNPADARTHNDLAWLLAACPDPKVRDVERAQKLAKRAVELAREEGDYWNTLGVAHYRAGDWKAAVDALKKSDALVGDKALGVNAFFLAMAHWQQGDKPEARAWYAKAVVWMESKKAELERNPQGRDELRRFHAEAAALLGIQEESPPRDQAK